MQTKVKTVTGKVLNVKDFFNNNGKGAYDGKVLVGNQEISTYWFFKEKENKITFITNPFVFKGVKYSDAKGEVFQMSEELAQRLQDKITRENKRKQEAKTERISQMYNY